MKKKLLILILFSLLWNEVWSQSNLNFEENIPLKKRIEATDYNGGIQNWAIDQNKEGLLYVANNEGLLEFDGKEWQIYPTSALSKLRALKVDKTNKIYVGGQGQIGYFENINSKLVYQSLLELLPKEQRDIAETWNIIELNQEIYFNTESQIFVYNGKDITTLKLPGRLQHAFKIENKIVAQFYQMGLFELKNKTFISIESPKNLPELISILPQEKGYYYLSSSGQLFAHNGSETKPVALGFELGSVNAGIKLHSGNYAIGTQNNGLFILNQDLTIKHHLTKNRGLTNRTVRSIYEDNFQNLWIGLNNGIEYLEFSLPFSLINEESGVEGTGYNAAKFNKSIYLGTTNGVFTHNPKKLNYTNSQYELIPGSSGQAYNFSIVDNTLICNHHNGAFKIENNSLELFHDMGSWKFIPTSNQDLIIGGDYHGISIFQDENGQWTKIGSISDLNESSRIMEFENDSILWMTHGSKGAYRILLNEERNDQKKIEHYGVDAGFPSNFLISVYNLNNKLIFTSERGIFDFNKEKNTFTENNFFNKWLGKSHISEIASNHKILGNTLYYIQEKKVGRLTEETFGNFKNETNLFNRINKFLNDDLPNISILDDQHVLIGAKEGFINYNPKQEFAIQKDFRVLIRGIDITTSADSIASYNAAFMQNREIEDKRSIKFSYAAPYFDGYDDLKYSYRLTPQSSQWSEWVATGEKEYTHLPAGNYTFEVKALNIYGIESEVATIPFKVMPPWYLSSLAVSFYILLGLLALTLIPFIQSKKHKTEKTILSESKERALKVKDSQIDQITESSKKEINKLLNEKLKSEINHKNGQLTSVTLNLIDKNEFMVDVRKKLETTLKQGGTKEELKRIIKTIDKNITDNDSWDQFSYHFDQVHGDYLKKLSSYSIKLSPQEIKLAAFLRLNMSSKEISKLMNISVRGVELARYRLRKKLKLERDQNLVEYLIDLDTSSEP